MPLDVPRRLVELSDSLAADCRELSFSAPVTHVYSPLIYARSVFRNYLQRYATGPRKVLFLGMNPGPFGMAQTGIPFGEVAAVRDWLGLKGRIGRPESECGNRPVQGFDCPRSEVSGRRLWSTFRDRFGTADRFFEHNLVLNYCPLLFLSSSGRNCRNLTPDKLAKNELAPLVELCDSYLTGVAGILGIETAVGVGKFAAARLRASLQDSVRVVDMPHPSPANPAANGDYQQLALRALRAGGVWD